MSGKDVSYYMARNYIVQMKQDGSTCSAWIPELPGCITQAESISECIKQLEEAKRLWLETAISRGKAVPEPRSDDFSGRILLRLPKYLHARLSGQAEEEGTSLNQYLVSLLSGESSYPVALTSTDGDAGSAVQGLDTQVLASGFLHPETFDRMADEICRNVPRGLRIRLVLFDFDGKVESLLGKILGNQPFRLQIPQAAGGGKLISSSRFDILMFEKDVLSGDTGEVITGYRNSYEEVFTDQADAALFCLSDTETVLPETVAALVHAVFAGDIHLLHTAYQPITFREFAGAQKLFSVDPEFETWHITLSVDSDRSALSSSECFLTEHLNLIVPTDRKFAFASAQSGMTSLKIEQAKEIIQQYASSVDMCDMKGDDLLKTVVSLFAKLSYLFGAVPSSSFLRKCMNTLSGHPDTSATSASILLNIRKLVLEDPLQKAAEEENVWTDGLVRAGNLLRTAMENSYSPVESSFMEEKCLDEFSSLIELAKCNPHR